MSKFETVDYAIDAGVALITLNRPQSMNAFNRQMRRDVLAAVRLTGAIFFDNTFRPPWVAETPEVSIFAGKVMPGADHVFCFHTLLEGSCWAEMTDGSLESIQLNTGDIIAFPKDAPHTLCTNRGRRV